eukprot:13490914-Alexandrium_andersonii.AAC.1
MSGTQSKVLDSQQSATNGRSHRRSAQELWKAPAHASSCQSPGAFAPKNVLRAPACCLVRRI